MAGAFQINTIFLAHEDKSLSAIDFKTGVDINKKADAHLGKVFGVSLIPHINQIVSAGGSLLKLWDQDFKLLATMNDSKAPITGYTMFKLEDRLIGAINKKGLVFWKQCDLDKCQICKSKNECHTCQEGFKAGPSKTDKTKQVCYGYGSELNPIRWKIEHLNIDRTKFRFTFLDVEEIFP